jgi:Flp pilus assembly pilin Flp
MRKICGYFGREEGQTMAEYGVVLTVITIATLGALQYLGSSVAKALVGISRFIS